MRNPIRVAAMFLAGMGLASPPTILAQAAPTVTAKPGGPRIKFSESSVDFGKVTSSAILHHDFQVTNTGDTLLEISQVTPACGCTVAGTWDRQIQPGQTGRIPIQFSPAIFTGSVTKSISVTCNDPTQATISLQIKATVWRPIDVQPPYVIFTPIEGEEANETKVLRISSVIDQPLTLEPPLSSNPDFKLELKTVPPGREFELRVTYTGVIHDATTSGSISIKTSFSDHPIINVGTTVMPQPALAAVPAQITVPADQLKAGYQHSQMILNRSSLPVKLTAATVNAPGVATKIAELRPGMLFNLSLSFPPNFQIRNTPPLQLTVHSSNPQRPVLIIPIGLASPQTAPSLVTTPTPATEGSN